jgi:hypothetical protein
VKRELLLVGLFTALALGLRIAGAWHMSYWVDDLGTLAQAHRIDSIAAALVADPKDWHPPLSFLFAKAWLLLSGLSGKPGEELAVRAPFLVLGALAVPLVFLVARRMLERGALPVAFAVAVHPLLVWSDRDIRGYALLVPLALAATLFWLRAADRAKGSPVLDRCVFVFFAALACWDHYNAIPFAAALLALDFLEGRRITAILSGIAILGLFAPWLPAMKEHLETIPFGKHEGHVQLAVKPVAVTAPCYVLFGMVLGYTVFPWNLPVVIPAALSSLVLAFQGFLGARGLRERRAAFLGLLLPVAGAAATSFKMPRYHVASVPFLLVLLARGAGRTTLGPRIFAVLVAAMIFSDVELLRGREHHFLFPLHPWREAEAVVRARPAPVVGPPGPLTWLYVGDLSAGDPAVAPVGSSCWLLVDEQTTEADEQRETAGLEAKGLRATDDVPLLVDPDHEARDRFVERGVREKVVRLVRFESSK